MKSHVESASWSFALVTLFFAAVSLMVLFDHPEALGLALGFGILALIAKSVFNKVQESTSKKQPAQTTIANAGLVLASISIAPLVLFAFLWAALLGILGLTWLLSTVGLI